MKVEITDLSAMFINAFNNKDLILSIESDRNSLTGWDSMGHLNLIVEIEDNLKITFSKDEIESIKSVRELIEILKTK